MAAGAEHEGLVELFRQRLDLAPTLLSSILGVELPENLDKLAFEAVESKIGELVPTEYSADLVITLKKKRKVVFGLILEIQRSRELEKRLVWPYYQTALRARLKCPTTLIVVCPSKTMEPWCKRPIETGQPGFVFNPLVLGPSNVPLIQDKKEAQNPEMAVLSAVTHGDEPGGLQAALVAFDLISALDDQTATVYHDLIMRALSAAFRQELKAMVASGKYVFQSEFAKKHQGLGREEGRQEEARLLLKMMRIKYGDAVTEQVEAQVLKASQKLLERYGERLMTQDKLEDVLSDD